ncbi:MAG: ABC transporter substrate-binding protein, partial [Actinobacteria bacterium]|nr:ABC transporter substrate-binding protein [Actinomycetota bacterium]
MGRKVRLLAIVAGLAVATSIAATTASGAHQADPGITKTSIHIGGTFPLTGVASAYKTIPSAESAYFAYVNAHGGVNGRKIDFTVLDDAYNPA